MRIVEVGHRLAAHVVDLAQHEIGIVEPPGRLLARKPGQRDAAGIRRSVHVGDDGHLGKALGRELARNLETPDGIDLVAEQVDAVGFALRIGEDVDDAAAQRILPRLVDEIHPHERSVDQRLLQRADGDAVAHLHPDCAPLQRFGVGHPLGQRLGVGADHQIALPVETAQGIHRSRALHDSLGILCAVGRRPLPRRRKEADARLVEQSVEVVQQVGRSVAVLGHEKMHAPAPCHASRGIERQRTADQLLKMDDGALLPVCTAQLLQVLRPGSELRHLFMKRHDEKGER